MSTATELKSEVLRYVRDLRPEAMSGADAARVVEQLALVEKAAATGRMFAALRVARTEAWRGRGHATAADWLAAVTGITVGRAAAQLRTARRADDLPKTKDAMAEGRLSPDQADAVTGAAAADPDAEDDLLRSAEEDTAAELRRKADAARAAATDAAERERRVRRERSVRYRNDSDGAFCLTLRGPADDGIALLARLRPFEEAARRAAKAAQRGGDDRGGDRRGGDDRGGDDRSTYDNRTYDAFQAMLRAGRPAGDPIGDQAGDQAGGSTGDASSSVRPMGGNNTKVIVRIDLDSLLRGHTEAGETCDVAGVGPVSVSTVQRWLRSGDPFLAAVVTKGRDVVNVAHLGRDLSAHQRTAIEAMGLRCTNVACNRTVGIQIDHRHPWSAEQVTRLANQDPLCPDCHRRKTHHGWRLAPGDGPRRFVPPDGVPPDGVPPDADPPSGRAGSDPPRVEQPTLC